MESCWVVHVRNEGLGVEVVVLFVPLVIRGGEDEDWCEVKFARREEVSSVFDFSKVGRRIMVVLVIMLLGGVSWDWWALRGGMDRTRWRV